MRKQNIPREQQKLARGIQPEAAIKEGAKEVITPDGFVVYLTIVAAHAGNPDGAGTNHAHHYLVANNTPLGKNDWDCTLDQLNFLGLTGEWFLQDKIDSVRGDRTKRFAEPVETLYVASHPWEARGMVNKVVENLMKVFEGEDHNAKETEFLRFMENCLLFMGHVMTGNLEAPHVRRIMNAVKGLKHTISHCTLHELLRKESVLMWDDFSEHSLGVRTMPLYRIIDKTIDLSHDDPANAADAATRRAGGRTGLHGRMLR